MMGFYQTDLCARVFDLQNADDPLLEAEAAFFLEEMNLSAGPVLDLGCGTGRILIPALKREINIYGCDLSEAFLRRARDAGVEADIEVENRLWRVDLGNPDQCPDKSSAARSAAFDSLVDEIPDASGGFVLAIAAFRTFDHLAIDGQHAAFLRSMHRMMHPEGRLLLNLANPMGADLESAMGEKVLLRDDLIDPETGHHIAWWGATHFEPGTNLILQAWCYDFIAPGGRVVESYHFPLTMRWTPDAEFRVLAGNAGFRVSNVWGGFDREPYARGTGDAVYELRPIH